MLIPQEIIRKKRDKLVLSKEEIHSFIHMYAVGQIPDYQMAALAMAIVLNGMTDNETSFYRLRYMAKTTRTVL